VVRISKAAVALAASAAVLCGCAAKPEIPFDRASAGDVKTIGIVTPAMPDDASVVLASTVGQSFGLIGGLIDAGLKASRDSHFHDILKQQGVAPNAVLAADLTKSLRAQGYTVLPLEIERDHKSDFLAKFPDGTGRPVDAYLDLVVDDYGYLAAGIGSSSPYRPFVKLRAKLVRASDRAVLMQDSIMYNPLNNPEHVVTISPDPRYQYKDFDTLTADPAGAATGLRVAIDTSVKSLSSLLR
jgi:hypothetical protein